MLDVEKFIGGIHEYVERAFSPFVKRIKALEDRQPERGEKGDLGQAGIKGDTGDKGDPGKDGAAGIKGDPGDAGINGKDGAPGLHGAGGDPGLAGENGKDGKPGADGLKGNAGDRGEKGDGGIDGKSVTVEDLRPMLEGEIAKGLLDLERRASDVLQKAIDRMQVAKDGKDGIAGRDGADGLAGKDATPIDEDALVARIAEVAVKHIPVPRDGIDGKDAAPIDPERVRDMVKAEVAAIPRPENGRDGRDAKGKDGADGLSIDDFDIEQKDDRTIVVSLRNKDKQVSREIKLKGLPIDRGVYKSGAAYQEGDGITYGGSWWLAQKDTSNTPGDASGDWRLAVKRGRDGKDA